MNTAVVCFGSNIDPKTNIQRTREQLMQNLELVAESKQYQTKPIGTLRQDDFTNGAFLLRTSLDYENFNSFLKNLEASLGRESTQDKFGPRTIDLDIVVWNNNIVHKDFRERDFVRNAVLEVCPDLLTFSLLIEGKSLACSVSIFASN